MQRANKQSLKVFASGGMGNQIFQFAFSLFLKQELGLKAEFVNLKKRTKLEHLNFDLSPFIPTQSPSVSSFFSLSKALLPIFDPWGSYRIHKIYGERYDFRFNHRVGPESLPKFKIPGHIVGYFQNYKFLELVSIDVLQVLINVMKQPENFSFMSADYEAIHIRGGDFLEGDNANTIGNLSSKYYEKLLGKNSNLPRVVVTNDFCFAKKLLENCNIDMYVDSLMTTQRETLSILANARRIFTANSTFSWVSGYLGEQLFNTEVILPYPFYRSEGLNYGFTLQNPKFDYFPADWI